MNCPSSLTACSKNEVSLAPKKPAPGESAGAAVLLPNPPCPLLALNKRWLLVAPPESRGKAFLLAEADTPEQSFAIGNQTGGRVFLFLHTDDFWRDSRPYQSRGVRFLESPRRESYGTVAVFADLYGNKWDLLQPVAQRAPNNR